MELLPAGTEQVLSGPSALQLASTEGSAPSRKASLLQQNQHRKDRGDLGKFPPPGQSRALGSQGGPQPKESRQARHAGKAPSRVFRDTTTTPQPLRRLDAAEPAPSWG